MRVLPPKEWFKDKDGNISTKKWLESIVVFAVIIGICLYMITSWTVSQFMIGELEDIIHKSTPSYAALEEFYSHAGITVSVKASYKISDSDVEKMRHHYCSYFLNELGWKEGDTRGFSKQVFCGSPLKQQKWSMWFCDTNSSAGAGITAYDSTEEYSIDVGKRYTAPAYGC